MGWFLTGVWVTLLLGLYVWQAITENINGMLISTGLLVVTTFLLGTAVMEKIK